MSSELDRRYDEMLARVTGPGGPLAIGKDERGRAIVSNFPATLPAFFRTFCALNAGNEALVAGEERLTFADLDRISEKVAGGLIARGIGKGDRVGIAMRNCPAWIVGYMAIAKAGGIATLLNGWWEAHEMEHAITLTEPKLISPTRRVQGESRPGAAASMSSACRSSVRSRKRSPICWEWRAKAQFCPRLRRRMTPPSCSPPGRRENSKGAVSTHGAVTTATYAYATGLIVLRGLLEQEGRAPATPPRTLLSVPLFHVTGEVPVMLNSFVVARCMVVMAKWDAGEALRLIEQERITYFVGVPTMSLEIMNHPDRANYDLSSLKDITAGGAPRPVSHVEQLRKEFPGAQPALGYGLTETNAVGCANFWGNYAAKPASTGRPHKPFVEIDILGAGERRLPACEVGEIAIRSAANVAGYWRNPTATAEAFTANGSVRTGDVGYLDEDGYLFIVDRKKDIIIRGGENISAAEVEAAIYGCSSVAEVAVFGVADDRLGEVPIAVVHPKDGDGLDPADLRMVLESRLARFKVPERIHVSPEPLPRLGTGKFDRRQLKALYGL